MMDISQQSIQKLSNLVEQLSAQVSTDDALQPLLNELKDGLIRFHQVEINRRDESERLKILAEIGRTICAGNDKRQTLSSALDNIIHLCGAERGFLMLKDEDGQLSIRIGREWDKVEIDESDRKISTSIIRKVAEEGQPILTDNAQEDVRFREQASIANFKLRSIACVPVIIRDQVIGAVYVDNCYQNGVFDDAETTLLAAFANHVALAIENTNLIDQLQITSMEISQAYDATILGWAKTLEQRGYETPGHSQRVIAMTMRLAKAMGVDNQEMIYYRRGAILHDIGKMAIPDQILLKPTTLDEDEWNIVHNHPEYGYELLSQVKILRPALDIVRYHHEAWDGNGYPKGLSGDKIPLAARIFSIVDVWDSLIFGRPYKKEWTRDDAMYYIQLQSGESFDPAVVEVFQKISKDV